MFQKRAPFLILFLMFLTSTIQAQSPVSKTIDSLKTVLKHAKNDSLKTAILTELSSYSEYIGPDNSIKYANQALFYAKKSNDSNQIGLAHSYLGIAYEIKSDYPHALINFYKSLEIIEKTEDKKELITLYNNIGLIYIDLKNYKQGLIFYNKALQLSYLSKKERNISLLLNNIGDVYLQKKEYVKAMNYFYKALIINKKINDLEGIGINLTNIGISYINIKNYEKGIEMLNKSIAIYGDDLNLYNSYNDYELGRAYYLMSEDKKYKNEKDQYVEKSIDLLEKVLQDFIKYNSLTDIQDTNFYLYKGYKSQGKIEIALKCFETYSTIRDSIFSNDSEKKLANLEFQREIDQRDQRIQIQTLKINSDSRKFFLLVMASSTVAVLLGLFLFLYISKRRNNELLQEKNILISEINRQKDKFYSIIAHDLRGPFNGFLGLTELMADDIDILTPEEVKSSARNIRSSARNLLDLLDNLLEWSRMEQKLIPFEPEEHSLKSIISDSIVTIHNTAAKKKIEIHSKIENHLTVFADKNMFQTIIRNLVLNAVKFTRKNGSIDINAIEDENDIIITVKDTGIGMNPKIIEDLFKIDKKNNRNGTENELSTGLGLLLCKEFIDKHNGEIWVESEEGKGSTFYISLPKSKTV